MNILITGATSGLGYLLACSLSRKGHLVYVASRSEKESIYLDLKIRKDKVILFPIVLDLLKHDDFKQIEELDIDVLVLHAGVGVGGKIEALNMDKMREAYEVNLFSNLELLQMFMKFCKEKQKKGKVFVTSSMLSHVPFPYLASYGSSKAGLSYCIKTLQRELALEPKNISVTLVEPGAYHTGFNQFLLESLEKNQVEVSGFDQEIKHLLSMLFIMMESFSLTSFVKKVEKEIEKEKPHKHIQMPLRQVIPIKIYQILEVLT